MEVNVIEADTGDIYWPKLCGNNSLHDAFWSVSLTQNSSTPDITTCFSSTILTWIPAGFLWISLILYYIPHLIRRNRTNVFCGWSLLNLIKVVTGTTLTVVSFTLLVFIVQELEASPAQVSAWAIKFVTLFVATCVVRIEFWKGVHTSGIISTFSLLLVLCEILPYRSCVIRYNDLIQGVFVRQTEFLLYSVYMAFALFQFILTLFSDKQAFGEWEYFKLSGRADTLVRGTEKEPLISSADAKSDVEETTKPSPELTVSFWSRITFVWLTKDVFRGFWKTVTFENLYDIPPEDKCNALLPKFYQHYYGLPEDSTITDEASMHLSGNLKPKNTFFSSLMKSCGWKLMYGVIIHTVAIILRILQPQVLKLLIIYVELKDPYTWKGVVLCGALLMTCLLSSLAMHNFMHVCWVTGMQVRTVVNAVVYRKAMRLSGAARKNTTVGEIVNLMSVDAQKLNDAFIYAPMLWEVIATLPPVLYFMWDCVGASAFSGLAVILVLFPVNGFLLANKVRKLQATQMEGKDERLKSMSEILAGIKILKLYAWEPRFIQRVVSMRDIELWSLKYANIITSMSNLGLYLCPYLISLSIFGTYVMASPYNILTADKAFVTRAYIGTLNFIVSMLPLSVSFLGQGLVSIKRINAYLSMEELAEDYVEKKSFSMKDAIQIENGTFSWDKSESNALHNLDIKVPIGSLVAVVGPVGAGKTSLISALLGEMDKISGKVKIKGNVAYVPQQAWIQNATVKDNMLFGRRHNKRKYDSVLDACALTQDLKILEGGDMCEIGEKGINLSGGQKQRISIARAVYQDEDIYLLDDPLSAVDAHVGRHIFDKVVGPRGLLRNKTRILVTHAMTYLPQTDLVIVLQDGGISEMGSYEELLRQDGAFAEFLRNYLTQKETDSTDEDDELWAALSAMSGTEDEGGKRFGTRRRSSAARGLDKRRISEFDVQVGGVGGERRESMFVTSVRGAKKEEAVQSQIEAESAEVGLVKWSVIGVFLSAAGWPMFFVLTFFHLLYTGGQVATNLWLSAWTADIPENGTYMPPEITKMRLGVYGGLGLGQAGLVFIVMISAAYGCIAASTNLHMVLLNRIIHAPMSFFDTTPLGRIMNRFSKDLDSLDTNIPLFLRGWLFCASLMVASIVIISYTTPIFIVAVIPILCFFAFLQRVYNTYMGQMKRLDSVKRSPIYAHFDESISGATSIRAYRKETEFIEKCDRLIDSSQRPWYHIVIAQRWSGFGMETLGAFVVFFAALFSVLQRDTLSPGLVGISISMGLQLITLLNTLVRCAAEMETHMVAVERIDEYCHVEQEAPWSIEGSTPKPSWPEAGKITFQEYSARYRAGLDLVLRDLSFSINAGEKVGIVGRTGAGKSSIALALFRIVEAATGTVIMDGIKMDRIGLHDVRSKITVIPQDPVVFSGSLRFNLDPYDAYTDADIWEALEHAHLKAYVEPLEKGLQHDCGEGGEGLSVGQRQLVCLTRALLRKTKVLVLDEATAAIDLETDALIQTTIRTQFKDCTVLTVAHRLNTILDYDRIMVLDKGKVKEFDTPQSLLADKRGVFYSMAKEAGLVSAY